MKICYIVGAFPFMRCGVGDYTSNLVGGVNNREINTSVITSVKAKNDKHVYNIMTKWNLRNMKKILNQIKKIKPDLVHIEYPSGEYKKNIMINILPLFIRIMGIKTIVTVHEYTMVSKLGKIRIILNTMLANKIIVVEKHYIDEISRHFVNKNKFEYIPIFSNIPKSISDNKKIEKIKNKYDLNNRFVLSYFGFLSKAKGFDYLLDSLYELVKENENILLLVIGTLSNENKYHMEIKEKIEKLNLEKYVKFIGFIDDPYDVADILKSTNVCVLPFVNGVSERNGSFLAAYNQEIQVITTSYDKEDGEGIYYAKPCNTESLKEKIKLSIKNKNIKINRAELTVDKCVDEHIKIYNSFFNKN